MEIIGNYREDLHIFPHEVSQIERNYCHFKVAFTLPKLLYTSKTFLKLKTKNIYFCFVFSLLGGNLENECYITLIFRYSPKCSVQMYSMF